MTLHAVRRVADETDRRVPIDGAVRRHLERRITGPVPVFPVLRAHRRGIALSIRLNRALHDKERDCTRDDTSEDRHHDLAPVNGDRQPSAWLTASKSRDTR